jgi:hypothetical protein
MFDIELITPPSGNIRLATLCHHPESFLQIYNFSLKNTEIFPNIRVFIK